MNIIITMAGLGSRFLDAGYSCPKYMIQAKGKTLFEWSMLSLLDYNDITEKYIFIVRKEHNARDFITAKMEALGVHNLEVVEIDYLTSGQAETALLGVEKCPNETSVLIFNIDTYVEPFELKKCELVGDGHIPCFHALGDHWSFVKEKKGKVVDVVEKKRISNNCSIGVYYFKTAEIYKNIYRIFYIENSFTNERYIAPMYKKMIDLGYQVTYSLVNPSSVHVLGTPKELEEFCNEKSN